MSIFRKIMEKLGIGKSAPDVRPYGVPSSPGSVPGSRPVGTPVANPAKAPISQVDVVAKLESLAKSNPQKLNWKTSIVDLMKLLGLDSSLTERKELAVELGCPKEKMSDSAQMNMWLHATVLRKLAENGGNIPAELLT